MTRVRSIPVVSQYKHVWHRARVKLKTRLTLQHRLEERVLFGANVIESREWLDNEAAEKVIIAGSQAFTVKSDTSPKKWLFYPDNRCMWVWSLIYTFLILETALVLPFRLAFFENDGGPAWRFIDLFVDMLFFMDMVKTLNTAYIDRYGQLECRRLSIIWNYLKSWFFLDLISCVPMYELQGQFLSSQETADQSQSSTFFRLMRVPRLYRLVKVSRFLKLIQELQNQECVSRLQGKIFFKNRTLTIVVFVLVTSMLIHMIACLWFLLARVEGFSLETWVTSRGLDGIDYRDQYVASLYWVVQTLSTVGYGDIQPGNSSERILASIWMLFSILFVSFTVGSISTALDSMKSIESIRVTNLSVIDEFAHQACLTKELKQRLITAINYSVAHESAGARLKYSVFSELPRDLRFEVSLAMHHGAAKSLSFFTNRDQAFITAIVPLLSHMFSPRLSPIYHQRDFADEVYFIVKGSVYIMATDKNAIRRMQKGAYFGEIEVMTQIPRKFGAITQGDCELLVLGKRGLGKIRKNFKQIYTEMEEIATVRDKLNERAKIQLFRFMRMTSVKHRRESWASATDSAPAVGSLPTTPRISLRVGSVSVRIPIMGRRFDPAESFDRLRLRMQGTERAISQVKTRLEKAMRIAGL